MAICDETGTLVSYTLLSVDEPWTIIDRSSQTSRVTYLQPIVRSEPERGQQGGLFCTWHRMEIVFVDLEFVTVFDTCSFHLALLKENGSETDIFMSQSRRLNCLLQWLLFCLNTDHFLISSHSVEVSRQSPHFWLIERLLPEKSFKNKD